MYNNYKSNKEEKRKKMEVHVAAQRSVAFFMGGRGRVLRRPNKCNAHTDYYTKTDEYN